MGWDTNLDPKKLPKIQDSGIDPPGLSMDDYIRFCARMRMSRAKNSSRRMNSLEEGLPVKVLFKL